MGMGGFVGRLICIVAYVKMKTTAEMEEFTKLRRLYSEDKK